MTQHRTAPTTHSITHVLLALFPVLLFILQLVGRVSILATIIAGALVCVKAVIELLVSSRQKKASPQAVSKKEQCHTCGTHHHDILHITIAGRNVRLCQSCYRSSWSRWCYS